MLPMSHSMSNANPSFAQGLHVLLVDHIEASITCLTAMLEHHSYKVMSTKLASEALSTITKQKYNFDLVIANADMPDVDILSFLRQVGKDIPIILTSGSKDIKVAMRSLAEGVSFFLMKPISKEDIKYLWQHVYRNKKGPGDLIKMKLNEGKRSHDNEIRDENLEVGKGDDVEEGQSNSERAREGEDNKTKKKKRIVWTEERCRKFTAVLSQLDKSKAQPKTILKMMNEPSLTRRHVSNHLRKYKVQVRRINAKGKDTYESEPRIQNSPTGVEFQQLNSSNCLQLSDIYARNFDVRGMNTNSSMSNMLIEHQLEENAQKQIPDFDDNNEFLAYLNLENVIFEDSDAVVEKADVAGGGLPQQYADLLKVLEEDSNGFGAEHHLGEVERYCEWLREDMI